MIILFIFQMYFLYFCWNMQDILDVYKLVPVIGYVPY